MPSEWATAKAKELLPCHQTCGLQDPRASRHHEDCPRRHRPALAAALDAAREQGEREERERWRRNVEDASVAVEVGLHRLGVLLAGPLYHSYAARVLRSLLSAPAEVAGREEDY